MAGPAPNPPLDPARGEPLDSPRDRAIHRAAIGLSAAGLFVGAVAIAWLTTLDPTTAFSPRIPSDHANLHGAARSAGPEGGTLATGPGKPADLPGDWPQFRGPDRSGALPDAAGLARNWPDAGPPALWSVTVGEGYAGPIVHAGRVYLMDYDRDKQADVLRCLSLADGQEIWNYSYSVVIKRNHGMSRTVPAIAGGIVVALGPKCHVLAVDAVTGELKWSIDLVREHGTRVPDWYAGQCPLIDGDRVILAPGGPDALLIAVELATGKVIWRAPNPRRWHMTHASIMPIEFAGRRMYVYPGSGGVVGVAPEDGRILWQTTEWKIPIATVPSPVDLGSGRLLMTGGYNAGSMILKLAPAEGGTFDVAVEAALRARDFACTQQTPIRRGDHVYGITASRGELACLDSKGEVTWTSGRDETFGLGPLLIAGDLIYALNDEGRLVLAEATPAGYSRLAAAQVLEGHEAWGPMALAGTRLLVRDFTTLRCLDVGKGIEP